MAEPSDVDINLRGQFGYQNVHIHTSQVLGTGSYGSVVKATLDHLPCAAKLLHATFFRSDDPGAVDFVRRFDQECTLLRDLKHPCIVQFLGVVQDPNNRRPILLMELMDESLTSFLEHAATSIPYHLQVNITYDIALALFYLHSNNIIHRDLSSNNVLLNAGNQTKVTDFGMSKLVEANPGMSRSKIIQCPGTPVFMPPEAMRAKPRCSDKLDIFSLGVLIVQIITRMFPAPTDAEIVLELEDDSAPTKIILVPELERRKKDITQVPPTHGLLPTALHCLKDRDKDRPTANQLCQSLKQLKAEQAFTASEGESQIRKSSLEHQLRITEEEKATEIARLQEEMRKLATEKEKQQQLKEREVADLRYQLQISPKSPALSEKKTFFRLFSKKKSDVPKPEASVVKYNHTNLMYYLYCAVFVYLQTEIIPDKVSTLQKASAQTETIASNPEVSGTRIISTMSCK